MKVWMRWLGAVALVGMAMPAFAADVSGAWKGAFEFNGSSVPVTLNLKEAGETVTGTLEGLPNSPVDIHDGKVAGDTVTFWLNSDYQGQTYKLVYKGKVVGDEIDFAFGTEDGSWGTDLVVKKDAVPAASSLDVSGAWKGAFDLNGTNVPLTFNLKSSGAVVTGTVDGLGPAPVDIHDGKLDGDTVTFWLTTDYQGQTYTVTYKGKLNNGQIDFSFGIPDGSWGAMMTVKKA